MRKALWVSLLCSLLFVGGGRSAAQQESLASVAPAGLEAEPDEVEAFWALSAERMVRARELSEKILAKRPGSYVAHFVLGQVEHDAEADFPRAVFHLEKALSLFETRYGKEPGPSTPWRWHTRILLALSFAEGEIEHHEKKLRLLAQYNRTYDPDRIAEQAWALMKLRRFDEARAAARAGLSTGEPRQREIALNALCAVEFEAENDLASYDACKQAMDNAKQLGADLDPADLMNFAEASRSVFKLDEAERVDREAADAQVAWYGNPWSELAELYVREGRLAEALSALKEVPGYRAARPPHVRESDRNENRRALASFFVVMGRAPDALRITEKAMVAPDRRGHNSRDPAQDISVSALLDRASRILVAELKIEGAVLEPWYQRLTVRGAAAWERVLAWLSGRRAVRAVGDPQRLSGSFRIGTARSAVMPPWLAGELVQVSGSGAARAAIAWARREDKRKAAASYYDAFEGEGAWLAGDERAVTLLSRAERGLPASEQLLRARVLAMLADARDDAGDARGRARDLERALQIDPGVVRRLELALPVAVRGVSGEVSELVALGIERSPRFSVEGSGFLITIAADRARGEVCLEGVSGGQLACAHAEAKANEDAHALAARLVASFHEQVFAPHIDLSVADANSLDGTNLRGDQQDLSPLLEGGALD